LLFNVCFIDVEDGNRITAQKHFSYFNIDKPAFATKKLFIHQFNQLIEVAKAVIPKENFNKAQVKYKSTY
jgi:hypothetical protein